MSASAAIVVMGVAGAGKTAVGERLAQQLGRRFVDGDDLHSVEARAKMAAGMPLDDDDRRPWLDRVAAELADGDIVVACSALRRAYRDRLRDARPVFVYLQIDTVTAGERVARRKGHFMGPEMIESQFATLEPAGADEPDVVAVDGTPSLDAVADAALTMLIGAGVGPFDRPEDLAAMTVHTDTSIGWCAATPPNETTDVDGNPVVRHRGFSAADPRAPRHRVHDAPDVEALRNRLRTANGLMGLEIFEPTAIDAAARAFWRDGFVVVADVLDADLLDRARRASADALRRILAIRGVGGRKYVTETARLPHRYSYGTSSASRQLLHEPLWAELVDLPTTTPLLVRLFGGTGSDDPGYLLRGAGGDLCLPGAIEYQALHWDRAEPWVFPEGRLAAARNNGVKEAGGPDGDAWRGLPPSVLQQVVERTAPKITINFLMSDLTWENGPIRQIPGTHGRADFPPAPGDEPEWMRLSTLVGAVAGSAVFRDVRAWHGATPNLSRQVRAMPNVEYQAVWDDRSDLRRVMPHEVWQGLSAFGKRISGEVVAPEGEWPAGAGVVHPLASVRLGAADHGLAAIGEAPDKRGGTA